MKIVFLATPDDVQREWGVVREFVAQCVAEAVHGEFDVDDAFQLSVAGRALPFYVIDDGVVNGAGLLEMKRYPKKIAMNVMALAGSGFNDSARAVFGEIVRFARSTGADFIEASVSPAMARLLRQVGFHSTYQTVRFGL